ncbi:MAG TPA: hydroxymethylbilane synthase [Thermomicrobiales bacterium]|nr:hydroxymethylbilane synthase [Thermomicrobiales bacterium]
MSNFVAMPTGTRPLLIGTRGSALALWQAHAVRDRLQDGAGVSAAELKVINSDGDRDKQSPLAAIGGRGVFASALQHALLAGEIDAAVHSAKDLPGLTPEGLEIAAFPERENPLDAIVSRHGVGLSELPPSPVIGTSSRRRAVQILALRPDATIVELRGNIDTRLRKSRSGDYDAIVIAAAGLIRMGWEDQITEVLAIDQFTPSPGQGVLAVETRLAPDAAASAVRRLDDEVVRLAIEAERAFLQGVGGGCTSPIGAFARLDGDRLEFFGMLASEDGDRIERVHGWFPLATARDRIFDAATRMLASIEGSWPGAPLASGQVASLRELRVLITGTPAVADGQAAQLELEGAIPVYVPTVRIEPAGDQVAIDRAAGSLVDGDVDWLVVTSANAVAPIAERLGGRREIAPSVQVAVVGERTAEALSNAGIRVDIVAGGGGATGLLAALEAQEMVGQRVLCLLSDIARSELVDGVRARGADVEVVIAYRTIAVDELDPGLRESLKAEPVDGVFFSSPSAVASLRTLLGADANVLDRAHLVAIGETTAEAMREVGLTVGAIASSPDPAAMIAALRSLLPYDERTSA